MRAYLHFYDLCQSVYLHLFFFHPLFMSFAIKPHLKYVLNGNNPTWLSFQVLIYQNVCRINIIEDYFWQSQIFWGLIFDRLKAAINNFVNLQMLLYVLAEVIYTLQKVSGLR